MGKHDANSVSWQKIISNDGDRVEANETNAAIICVDDESVILNSLGEQLKRSLGQEYDLELVESGAEAIALCAELVEEGIEIPIIICDQIMPGMTGDKLLIKLHSLYPDTIKILLTGQANADAVGNLVNANALYRYIAKPWSETDLILTVKEALKLYQQERQLAEKNATLLEVNQQLTSAISLLQATLDATADGILVLDSSGEVVNYNQKFVDIWGLPSTVKLNREQILTWVLQELTEPYASNLRERYARLASDNFNCLELKNGKILECYSQAQQLQEREIGQVWSFRDVTEHKKAQVIIQHQAFHDSLTNLPNRTLFDRELAKALKKAQRIDKMLAVMFLDLDRFKTINDTLGHAVGDLLLKSVVERLKHCLRQEDIIARWGGDEFTILLPEINSRQDASAIAQRILSVLKPSFKLEKHHLHITSSIGIAVFPEDGTDADVLLKNADTALYWVKEKGRNSYQHYALRLNAQARELLSLENDLHYALEKQELVLYYQPIIEVTTEKIVKLEALLRWQHRKLGLISPELFIPIAEENGLITAIGEWVLETASTQTKAWQDMGLSPLIVAVNLSARQFYNNDLVCTVKRILQQTKLNPGSLELEMTETATMHNTSLAKQILSNLHQMGISLSMDDFGTGYSSLSYLKDFPFNTLKIDRSFIKDLSVDSNNLAIIDAIATLGKGLNLQIVAEGVESEQLKNLLATLHCDYMQGYFLSPPLTVTEATELMLRSIKS
ncbi:EAL domain-containing protein [Pleurocapsales cyanobacterium LEGE 10410]|nr:EAL domain-containing protein [Pleurocapsales cyanobacterium LEGE 10410]